MKKTLVLVSVLALLSLVAVAQQQNSNPNSLLRITNGPGVQKLTPNSAEVFWNTTAKSGSVVHYGTSRDKLTETAESSWGATDHKVQLNNLQPDTTYYFQVISSQAEGTGADVKSGIGVFKTKSSSSATY